MKPWYGCPHYHQHCSSQCSHKKPSYRGCPGGSTCSGCNTPRCGCSNDTEMTLCSCNDYFDDFDDNNGDRTSDSLSEQSQRITETSQTPSQSIANRSVETEDIESKRKEKKKVTCSDIKHYSSSSCSMRNNGGCCNGPLMSALRKSPCTKDTCAQFPSDVSQNKDLQKYTYNFKLSSPSEDGECGGDDDDEDLSARLVIMKKGNKFSAHLTIMGEEVDVEKDSKDGDNNDDGGDKNKDGDKYRDGDKNKDGKNNKDLSTYKTGGDREGKTGSDSSDSNIDETVYDPVVKDRRHAEDHHYSHNKQIEIERKQLEKESEKKSSKSLSKPKESKESKKSKESKESKKSKESKESKEAKELKETKNTDDTKSEPKTPSEKESDEGSASENDEAEETKGTKSTNSSIKKEPDVILSACFDEIDFKQSTKSNYGEDRLENLIQLYEKNHTKPQKTITMPITMTPATTSTTKGNNLFGKLLFNKQVNEKNKKDDDNNNMGSGLIPINYTVDTPVMQFSRVASEKKSDETHPLYPGRSFSPPTLSRMQRAVYALPKGQMRKSAEYPQNKSTVLSHILPGESSHDKSKNK